jgi:uncharacterized protein YfaS (alpha-2-macroglobulin family)
VQDSIGAKYIRLDDSSDGTVRHVPFDVRHPTDKDFTDRAYEWKPFDHTLLVVPSEPLARERDCRVIVPAGLQSAPGGLGMRDDGSYTFHTPGPFRCLGVADSSADQWEFRLKFSNPIDVAEARHGIHVKSDTNESLQFYPSRKDTWTIRVLGSFVPGRTYTISLNGDMQDGYGNRLEGDTIFSFQPHATKTYIHSDVETSLREGDAVTPSLTTAVPFHAVDLDSVRVEVLRLIPDNVIPFSKWRPPNGEQASVETFLRSAKSSHDFKDPLTVESRTKKIASIHDATVFDTVDISGMLHKGEAGPVILQFTSASTADQSERPDLTLIQFTRLRVSARSSEPGGLVWISDLEDGTPVPKTHVEIRNIFNDVMWHGVTDSAGMAEFPGWKDLGEGNGQPLSELWAFAKTENDFAYCNLNWTDGALSSGSGQNPRWSYTLFTDRGIYRLGETVHFKGIIRQREGELLKAADDNRIVLRVNRGNGFEPLQIKPTISAFGSFDTSITLDTSFNLGTNYVALERWPDAGENGLKRGSLNLEEMGHVEFEIQEYRPLEIAVHAASPQTFLLAGDTALTTIDAEYLYGNAFSHRPVKWTAKLDRTFWHPKAFADFTFGNSTWRPGRYWSGRVISLAQRTDTLDASGTFTARQFISRDSLPGEAQLTIEGTIWSLSNQIVAGRVSMPIHPADFTIGLKANRRIGSSRKPFSAQVIALAYAGEHPVRRMLSLSVVHKLWEDTSSFDSTGRRHWGVRQRDTIVEERKIATSQKPIDISYDPKMPGLYVFRLEGFDSAGRRSSTEISWYAAGDGYFSWGTEDSSSVEIIPEKARYEPGDSATLFIKSPFHTCRAVVTVQRNGILEHFVAMLEGSTPRVSVYVPKDVFPNLFVSVWLQAIRADSSDSIPAHPFRGATIDLPVDPSSKRLTVQVSSDKASYAPGDEVELSISTRDTLDRPVRSEVTVSVADEGVLNLINYRFPDEFAKFYAHEADGSHSADSRLHLVDRTIAKLNTMLTNSMTTSGIVGGAVDAAHSVEIRKNFVSTAYWNPSIITDTSGTALVRFKLPDNATTFRVMAAAVDMDSRFGNGDTSFTVNKPLLLTNSLPRFLRVGDELEGGVIVHNLQSSTMHIRVKAVAAGVAMIGADTLSFDLGTGTSHTAHFRFRALRLDTAKFTLFAATNGFEDAVSYVLPVIQSHTRESVVLSESTVDSAVHEQIEIPRDILSDTGNIEVGASSSGLSRLREAVRYLIDNSNEGPNESIERYTIGLSGLIAASDLVEAYHINGLNANDLKDEIRRRLNVLYKFQKYDDAFSYWPPDRGSIDTREYWSAQAVCVLDQAKKAGFSIDDGKLHKAVEYLSKVGEVRMASDSNAASMLALSPDKESNLVPFHTYSLGAKQNTGAFILYDLALENVKLDNVLVNWIRQMCEHKEHLPLVARVYLARALHLMGGHDGDVRELLRLCTDEIKLAPASAHFETAKLHNWESIFNSGAYTTSLILETLIDIQPDNPLIPRIARWLLDRQIAGRWGSSIENASGLRSITAYFHLFENVRPDFSTTATLGESQLLTAKFSGRDLQIQNVFRPLNAFAQGTVYPLRFSREGDGRLYYFARMNYFPLGPIPELSEGILVTKSIEPFDTADHVVDSLKVGTVVKITLTVCTSQERSFVSLRDPLPAAFEIINPRYTTTSSEYRSRKYNNGWLYPFNNFERFDDRVELFANVLPAGVSTYTYLVQVSSAGAYVVPPARAEGLYEPEVFGQTPTMRIDIK